MKPYSVAPLVLAGISFAVGVYHLSMYARGRSRRRDLSFGLYCLVVTAFDVATHRLYDADDVAGAVGFQRAQFVLAGIGLACLLQFIVDVSEAPPTRAARAFLAFYVLFTAIALLEHGGLVLTDVPDTKVLDGPFGWRLVYHEVATGPLGDALLTSTVALVPVAAHQALPLLRRGERRRFGILVAALAVLFVGIFNDALVAAGQLSNVYMFEFSFLAMIVLVAADLSFEVARAAGMAGALAQSEARLGAILDAIADAVVAVDSRGRVVRMNPAAERLTGYEHHEALGKAADEILPLAREARPAHAGAHANATLRTRSGEERLVTVAEAQIASPGGPAVDAVLVLHDVTHERRIEAAMRESQQMESIGRIAGGVAHDFNNLLTPILGYAALSLKRLPPEDASRDAFHVIVDAATRGADLTRQLLAFGQRQILDVRTLNLGETVRNLLPLLRKVIREDVAIHADLDASVGAVRADRSQLEQIVMNLAVNARDAMPNGGALEIATSEATVDADAELGRPAGRYVVLSVRDTGVGIDDETRRHMFEPFYTTKGRGRGTGLGLATVHGIVQQHGGHIEVETATGRGTTFRLFFPRVEATAETIAPAVEPSTTGRGEGTVLVVDDDALVRRYTAHVLEDHGYRVVVAETGTDALARAESLPALDLVVTDVVLPGLDGRALVDALRAVRPGIGYVLMTGYADETDAPSGGASDAPMLAKPFRAAELLARVRESMEARRPAPERACGTLEGE